MPEVYQLALTFLILCVLLAVCSYVHRKTVAAINRRLRRLEDEVVSIDFDIEVLAILSDRTSP